jgi:hypothetical protein
VGMMPYDLSGWAGYCESPLKMYQYWAARVPIVSAPLPNLADEPGILSLAATPDQWIQRIEWELTHDSDLLRARRYAKALDNTWSSRADRVAAIIRDLP